MSGGWACYCKQLCSEKCRRQLKGWQQSRDYLTRSKLRSAVAEGTIPVEGGEEVQSADGGGDAYERYCRQVLRDHQGDIVYP